MRESCEASQFGARREPGGVAAEALTAWRPTVGTPVLTGLSGLNGRGRCVCGDRRAACGGVCVRDASERWDAPPCRGCGCEAVTGAWLCWGDGDLVHVLHLCGCDGCGSVASLSGGSGFPGASSSSLLTAAWLQEESSTLSSKGRFPARGHRG